MARTFPHPAEHTHPDAARVIGITGALAFNAALLLLLMRPIELPDQAASAEPMPTPAWIVAKPKPIDEVKIEKPHPVTQQAQAIPHPQPQQKQQPVVTENANLMSRDAIDPPPDVAQPPQIIDAGGSDKAPIEASLAYLDASPPPYPRDALREGIEGTVQLRVLVDETGHVLEVQIERSSGDHELDIAAREHVLRRWLFQPAQRNGVPMRAWGRVPVRFRLDGR